MTKRPVYPVGERIVYRSAEEAFQAEHPCLVEPTPCARCGKTHLWMGCRAEMPLDRDAWCENCQITEPRRPTTGDE